MLSWWPEIVESLVINTNSFVNERHCFTKTTFRIVCGLTDPLLLDFPISFLWLSLESETNTASVNSSKAGSSDQACLLKSLLKLGFIG